MSVCVSEYDFCFSIHLSAPANTCLGRYMNMMVVLEGQKTVELWPPGEPSLLRSAGVAWRHHCANPPVGGSRTHPRTSRQSSGDAGCCEGDGGAGVGDGMPLATEVYVLGAGDVGFWPEGWCVIVVAVVVMVFWVNR